MKKKKKLLREEKKLTLFQVGANTTKTRDIQHGRRRMTQKHTHTLSYVLHHSHCGVDEKKKK